MRIVYLTSSPVPSKAANSVHVMKMAQALAKLGHKTMLIAPEYGRTEPFEVADPYAFYGVSRTFQFIRGPALTRISNKELAHYWFVRAVLFFFRPDIVYSRCLKMAQRLTKDGFKVIAERHDLIHKAHAVEPFKQLIARKNCLGLVVISDALKAAMVREYDLPEAKIFVAHDAADAPPEALELAVLPETGHKRAGYIGHLYEGRGIDVIIGAARLKPQIAFHIVGGNPEDVTRWQVQASDLGNVTFHGHVAPSETVRYTASFDCLLAPYQRKVAVHGGGDTAQWMSPLKIFEYMSSGRPLICSDLPVLREILRPDENAVLCPPDDIQAWADAIEKVCTDTEFAHHIAAAAKADFEAHYTWTGRAKAILAHFTGQGA